MKTIHLTMVASIMGEKARSNWKDAKKHQENESNKFQNEIEAFTRKHKK